MSGVLVRLILRRLADGHLRIVDGARSYDFGEPDAALRATVTLHDRTVWRANAHAFPCRVWIADRALAGKYFPILAELAVSINNEPGSAFVDPLQHLNRWSHDACYFDLLRQHRVQ